MMYTRRTVWPLVFGIIMVAYAYLVQSGVMEPVIKFLGTARIVGEMQMLGYCFGAIGILAGLWQLLAPPKEGQADYYLSMAGGLVFIMMVAPGMESMAQPLPPIVHMWSIIYMQKTTMQEFFHRCVQNMNFIPLKLVSISFRPGRLRSMSFLQII